MAGKLPPGVTPRQRSAALGGAAHRVVETWYSGEPAPWHTFPGLVIEAGRHLLPRPGSALLRVEAPIGSEPLPAVQWPGSAIDKGPRVGLRLDGIMWAGFRDLVVLESAPELARLKINAPAGVALFDHKTTASIGRYAKSPATLATDLQCNLYAIATMLETGVDSLPARWVYYETKEVRRALPIDVVIERSRALDVIGPAAELTRTLDAIERSVDAPQNVNACGDYGGCAYHVTAGGPCDARRAVGKLIQLNRKGKSMALTEDQKAKFAAFRKTPATNGAHAEGAETEEPAAPASAAPAPAPAPVQLPLPGVNAEAPRPRGRPRKVQPGSPSAAPSTPAHVAAVVGGLADVIARAHAKIAEAEVVIAGATAQREEAIASLRTALG